MDTQALEEQIGPLRERGAFQAIRTLLEQHPLATADSALLLDQLGHACLRTGDVDAALRYLQAAQRMTPNAPELYNHIGTAFRIKGIWAEAERHYLEALRLRPHYAEALNNVGALYYRQGRWKEARSFFEQALEAKANYWDAHRNLANTLIQCEEPAQAESHYRRVLSQYPDDISVCHNLGILLVTQGRFAEAKPLLQTALAQDTPMADARFHLGMIATAEGAFEQAKTYYEEVLSQAPTHSNAHHNLATIHLHLGRYEDAKVHFGAALSANPNNATAQHFLQALEGNTPATTSSAFLTELFDFYAPHYDHHLKEGLAYQVPEAIRQTLTPFARQAGQPWDILDVGCGTGLMAPYLQDLCLHLIGIDLSDNMIQKAKRLGGYTKLHTGDCLAILPSTYPQYADCLIAADVLVYHGDLHPFLDAFTAALKPQGLLCFTTESSEDKEDYTIQRTGRFAHARDYVEQALVQRGYSVLEDASVTLRRHDDHAQKGTLWLAQKA